MTRNLNLGGKAPRCPLCEGWMEKKFEPARGFFIFACDVDKIACRVDDPFVGRWDQALESSEKATGGRLECPNPGCSGRVRYFATSTGFARIKCAKCGATATMSEPDRKTDTPDKVYTPEAPGVVQ